MPSLVFRFDNFRACSESLHSFSADHADEQSAVDVNHSPLDCYLVERSDESDGRTLHLDSASEMEASEKKKDGNRKADQEAAAEQIDFVHTVKLPWNNQSGDYMIIPRGLRVRSHVTQKSNCVRLEPLIFQLDNMAILPRFLFHNVALRTLEDYPHAAHFYASEILLRVETDHELMITYGESHLEAVMIIRTDDQTLKTTETGSVCLKVKRRLLEIFRTVCREAFGDEMCDVRLGIDAFDRHDARDLLRFIDLTDVNSVSESEALKGEKATQNDELPPLCAAPNDSDRRLSDLKINDLTYFDHGSQKMLTMTRQNDMPPSRTAAGAPDHDDGSDSDLNDSEDSDEDIMHPFDAKEKKREVSSDSTLPSVYATGKKTRQIDELPPLRVAAGAPDYDDSSDDDSDEDDDKDKRLSKTAGEKEDPKSRSQTPNDAIERLYTGKPLEIPFEELNAATDGFNSSSVTKRGCLIGSGSFGDVYLGRLRNNVFVAVKKFKPVLEN